MERINAIALNVLECMKAIDDDDAHLSLVSCEQPLTSKGGRFIKTGTKEKCRSAHGNQSGFIFQSNYGQLCRFLLALLLILMFKRQGSVLEYKKENAGPKKYSSPV